MSILRKIFGDANEKYLKKLEPIVKKINSLESEIEKLSNAQLKEKTAEFKQRLGKGEGLDDILPGAFALVREAAKRSLAQRHFDVQLIGGIILHQGKIAEMKTGEGKTLAATLAVYLNALTGDGVHIVTVNDYLTRRDTVWMGQIYDLLGLSVGCIAHEAAFLYDSQFKEKDQIRDEVGGFKVVEDFLRPISRKEAYLADITYGTNNEFGFDYLRDNMIYDLKDQVQRPAPLTGKGFNFAIVDEVDSILIDEARTPLIISAPGDESTERYYQFARIIERLKENHDYTLVEKERATTFTEAGQNRIVQYLGWDPWLENDISTTHQLESALRAKTLFIKDKDYVTKDGQVVIVDSFTGRLMPGRRWSGGLHQAVEAKENLEVQKESRTFATITFQNYFRLYKKLAGMTGTASTSAEEFDKVYNLEVIIIPTNKPLIRKEVSDHIFKNLDGKFKAVVNEIKERNKKGQPILVGTVSIEKNEFLGKLLDREGIAHQILNAKHHEKEGQIIAQAGRLGAVTIATNMAGRGVDIILGGNPQNPKQSQEVCELGGLHVIGTERHEARRIDNQLRGRAGRQGDPGSSQFFVSLEDDLMRIFGGDKIKGLMETLRLPEDQPIEAKMVSRAIESAQAKVEGMNFDLRKHILEYDDVMNKHREVFYKKRREVLNVGAKLLSKELSSYKLRIYDLLWVEHLENMEHLRDSVRLRAYGQQDPLIEYKSEAHKMFQQLLKTIDQAIIKQPVLTKGAKLLGKKPGRNQPCPCGSNKKYKKCCWPKYG